MCHRRCGDEEQREPVLFMSMIEMKTTQKKGIDSQCEFDDTMCYSLDSLTVVIQAILQTLSRSNG
jgi:hypothetical protein